jgi:apolipoprotein N-acyltransferase
VAALQGNIDQGQKWSPDLLGRTFGIYEDLAREAAADGAQLIVWPETALPVPIDLTPGTRERLQVLARETGAAHVVGAVGVAVDQVGQIEAYFDSAFLLASDGNLLDRYDKSHLVPFGEYVPLRGQLGRFVHALARGIADSDVTPGPAPRAIDVLLHTWDGGERQVRVGVPICYELLFPDLVRRFVRDGAGVLLAITNDAWYGRTGAPYQFLAMTALRSAETGVWTVRAANTGVSAFIDGSGRVVEETKIFERDWIVADVPLRPPEKSQTFYVRHGDVFAIACWVALFVVFAVGIRRNELEKRRERA